MNEWLVDEIGYVYTEMKRKYLSVFNDILEEYLGEIDPDKNLSEKISELDFHIAHNLYKDIFEKTKVTVYK